jgi:hypothetical protein
VKQSKRPWKARCGDATSIFTVSVCVLLIMLPFVALSTNGTNERHG